MHILQVKAWPKKWSRFEFERCYQPGLEKNLKKLEKKATTANQIIQSDFQ